MKARQYAYRVIFEPAEEGGYVVRVPALPGVVTQGETLKEARAMAQEAILGYLESLQKDGLPIPTETTISRKPIQEQVRIPFVSA